MISIYYGNGCPGPGYRIKLSLWIGHYGDPDVPFEGGLGIVRLAQRVLWMLREDWREFKVAHGR